MNSVLRQLFLILILCFIGDLHVAWASEAITYYHVDALGSPVAASDEVGNLKWQEQYRPYGERIKKEPASVANFRYYTGHPHDETTGLTYAGARYYDPVVGRFMGVDPKDFSETNIHSFNRYAYGNNNPYKYVDPDGEASVTVSGGIIASIVSSGSGVDATAGRLVGFSVSLPSATSEFDLGLTITNVGGAGANVPPILTRVPKLKARLGPILDITVQKGSVLDLESPTTEASGDLVLGGPHITFDQDRNFTGGGIHATSGAGFSVTGQKTKVISLRRGLRRLETDIKQRFERSLERIGDQLLRPRPHTELTN